MSDFKYEHINDVGYEVCTQLRRIADAQEALLAIALEARGERMKMAAKMADALKRPLEEKPL